MAELNVLRVCSSILPWRSCGTQAPWAGANSARRTSAAVAAVEAAVPKSCVVSATYRHRAFVGETRISDHDAYVVGVASGTSVE